MIRANGMEIRNMQNQQFFYINNSLIAPSGYFEALYAIEANGIINNTHFIKSEKYQNTDEVNRAIYASGAEHKLVVNNCTFTNLTATS